MPNLLLSNDSPLSFKEFAMREGIPLSQIHHEVLSYLKDSTDIAIFGAQADKTRFTMAQFRVFCFMLRFPELG